MKTQNLNDLAQLLLKLTWSEMQHLVSSRAFGSPYASTNPEEIMRWSNQQLEPEKIQHGEAAA